MIRSALVTGASGFVGYCLVKHLLKNGWHVHLLLREKSVNEVFPGNKHLVLHRCNGSYESIESIIRLSKPDIVYHLASLFLAQHKPSDVGPLVTSNLLFPTLLLEAMNNCGIRHFINTGTSWQNYQSQTYTPVNLYASTKEAFEKLALFYIDAHGFKITTLRLFDTYGPGDKRKKLFFLLREAAKSGSVLKMSPGDQIINLVYGMDVAEAFLIAGEELLKSEYPTNNIYGVSSPQVLTLRELVTCYSKTTNHTVSVEWGALPYRTREVMIPYADYPVLSNWTAKTPLEEGILKMESDINIQGLLTSNEK